MHRFELCRPARAEAIADRAGCVQEGIHVANDKQFKLNTMFIGTRGVREYRETIAE